MSFILDYIASTVLFGLMFLSVLWTNFNMNAKVIKNRMQAVAQTNAVQLALQIEHDFLKIGFRKSGQKILSATSTSIRFYADLDRLNRMNEVQYSIGSASDLSFTQNPNDFPLIRTVDGGAVRQNFGLVQFQISYYNSSHALLPVPMSDSASLSRIETIGVHFRVESPDPAISPYDTTWASISWEKLLVPRNIGGNCYY